MSKLSLFSKLPLFGSKRVLKTAPEDIESAISANLSQASRFDEEDALNQSLISSSPYTASKEPPVDTKKQKLLKNPSLKKNLLEKRHTSFVLEENELTSASVLTSENKIKITNLSQTAAQTHLAIDEMKEKMGNTEWENAIFSSALAASKTIARPITLEFYKSEELDEIIKYQMEPHLPYPIENAQISSIQFSQNASSPYFFQAFSTQKKDLKEHLQDISTLAIDPEIVAPKSVGLLSFIKTFFNDDNTRFFLDISKSETILVLMHQKMALSIRTIPMSLEDPQDRENHLENYAQELSRILIALKAQFPFSEHAPCVFTGSSEEDSFLLSLLAKLLGMPEEKLTTLPHNVTLAPSLCLARVSECAVAIGLALLSSPFKGALSFTWRKGEFTYAKKWRRWKKDLLFYFGAIFSLTLLLYTTLFSSLKQEEKAIIQEYKNLLALINISALDVEKAYLKFSQNSSDVAITQFSCDLLSPQEIEERTLFIENTLLKKPYKEIALHPNVARVSDLLAFLASHPLTQDGSLVFEKMRYNMVKRPDKEHLKDHYKVHVTLEFSTPNPTKAREFYDALNSPNIFVDPKEELQWNTAKDRYTVSFVLKDKTQYP